MKICFLADAASLHSKRWIEYFAKKGYEIYWVSLTKNYFGDIEGVKFYRLLKSGFKPLDILLNVMPLIILLKKIKPDILHVHYAGVNGVLGALSGFHPFILTVYGSDILVVPKKRLIKSAMKFVLKKTDLITCNGKTLRDRMIKFETDPRKIKFIYWGTDLQKFKRSPKNKGILKKLNIFGSSVVISLRNFETVYNIETLIKAIPLVIKEIPQVKFIIVGKGSQETKIKNLAQSLNVLKYIRFTGWLSEDMVCQYLNLADIYVSTSLSDGDLSQSTQQAMACEVPIITTDLYVNKNRIKNGENGIIFPQKCPELLAQKIVMLLQDKELRSKLGKEGRKTVENHFDFNKEIEKAENIYEDLVKSKYDTLS
jgi:glycosyltransferase involved in cell wall biosynthesis